MNYEDIENDKTLSTIKKIVLYQKAIDDAKRKQIYFAANQGKLLKRGFIQGRDIYNKTFKRKWCKQMIGLFLTKGYKASRRS